MEACEDWWRLVLSCEDWWRSGRRGLHFLFVAARAQPAHGTCVVVAFALVPLLLPLSPAREVSPDIIWKMRK